MPHEYNLFADEKIPTIKVDVPNTEHGHCKKSEAILQIMMNKLTENSIFQWVVLADDDTILRYLFKNLV